MLWVALELPALPLQIAERAGASSDALAISEGPAQRPIVACANAEAKAAGVREGQAVAAAKALAGELRVLARDPAAERETLEGLAAWAGQFTPMVIVEAQGILLEIESCLRLFNGHAQLTAAILRGIRNLGFHAAIGVAPTPLAARIIARAEAQGLQVRSCLTVEELRSRLAELPLFLFDWPEATLARLTDLGVLRVKDVLELPAEGIARRFGPEIVLSLDRLVGRQCDPRVPYSPPPKFRSRIELPAEADGVEALLFPLRRLLVQFEGYARGRGAGAQRLSLTLEHGRKSRTHLALDFASPERETDFILSIAREKLGRLKLVSPTIALALRVDALLAYTPRTAAWLPGAQEQAIGRERLLERLAARLGRDRVFGIAVASDHRPESNWGRISNSGFGVRRPMPGAATPGPRPTWLLNRPQRLITEGGTPLLQGHLDLAAGPERIESGWWDSKEVSRDYYVALNPHGERCWIYREHRDPDGWYLHGLFA
jgi:protein ImuB